MNKKTLILCTVFILTLSLSCSLFNPSGDQSDSTDTQPQSSAESTPGNIQAGGPSNDPCNNVFYPLLPGNQLVYKIDTPDGDSQVGLTVASVNGSEAIVDMLYVSTGIVTQSTITCDAGAIKQYPLATMDTLFGDMVDGTLNMDYVSGVIAPAEETLAGNSWDMSWESHYIMNGTMTFAAESESTTVVIDDSPVVMKWKVDSTGQTLTVPAGTYTNVVVVTREMTAKISMGMGTMMVDSTLLIESTHWFEPYLGMVKMTVDTTSVQVQGMTFPVATNETMELIEVRSGE